MRFGPQQGEEEEEQEQEEQEEQDDDYFDASVDIGPPPHYEVSESLLKTSMHSKHS